METITKTYAMPGLMECKALVSNGRVTLNVHFTGGYSTAYGSLPAKYTTSDQIYQAVIEGSKQFRNGRIKLVDVKRSGKVDKGMAVNHPRKTAINLPAEEGDGPGYSADAGETGASSLNSGKNGDAPGSAADCLEGAAEAATPDQAGGTASGVSGVAFNAVETAEGKGEKGEKGTVVKVACVQDAAAWLKLNYGVAGSRLHGEKAVIETGRKYGIEFDFKG